MLICGARKTVSFCSVTCHCLDSVRDEWYSVVSKNIIIFSVSCSYNCEFSYSCISLALKSGHLPEVTCALDCIPLKPSNYLEILWTAAAEFPGILNNIIRDVL